MRIIMKLKKGNFDVRGIGYIRPYDKSFAFDGNDAREQIEIFPATKIELQLFIRDLQKLHDSFDTPREELM